IDSEVSRNVPKLDRTLPRWMSRVRPPFPAPSHADSRSRPEQVFFRIPLPASLPQVAFPIAPSNRLVVAGGGFRWGRVDTCHRYSLTQVFRRASGVTGFLEEVPGAARVPP